jgi:hypothetical protein
MSIGGLPTTHDAHVYLPRRGGQLGQTYQLRCKTNARWNHAAMALGIQKAAACNCVQTVSLGGFRTSPWKFSWTVENQRQSRLAGRP